MAISDHLAYSQGRKDQIPNKLLAQEITSTGDSERLIELIQFIESKPHRRLQMDAALTVAYVGDLLPKMLIPHVDFLIEKLKDPIDRVAWGSMIALSHVSPLVIDQMYERLPEILDAMDMGSIVGRDHGYQVLVNLYKEDRYVSDMIFILLEQIRKAPSNQLGQYTERLMKVIRDEDRPELVTALEERRLELTNEYHLKRLTKNLKKLY